MVKVKVMPEERIKGILTVDRAMKIVEKVYWAQGSGRVNMPPKITLDLGEQGDWPSYGGGFNAMPAYVCLDEFEIAGIKWACGYHNNYLSGLPSVNATILLNNPVNGQTVAVMGGTFITDVRTGAATGVAAKYLAAKRSSTLGIIGAGVQGRMNLRALNKVLELQEVRIYDCNKEKLNEYVDVMTAETGLKIMAVGGYREAAEGADVIVTATIANEPIVMKEWLKKGCTVFSLGSYQELNENIPLSADKLVVDSWGQNSHRGELSKLIGAGRISQEDVYAELPDIVANRKAGRENDEEIICACIIGMGSTDIGIAGDIYFNEMSRGDCNTIIM